MHIRQALYNCAKSSAKNKAIVQLAVDVTGVAEGLRGDWWE